MQSKEKVKIRLMLWPFGKSGHRNNSDGHRPIQHKKETPWYVFLVFLPVLLRGVSILQGITS